MGAGSNISFSGVGGHSGYGGGFGTGKEFSVEGRFCAHVFPTFPPKIQSERNKKKDNMEAPVSKRVEVTYQCRRTTIFVTTEDQEIGLRKKVQSRLSIPDGQYRYTLDKKIYFDTLMSSKLFFEFLIISSN